MKTLKAIGYQMLLMLILFSFAGCGSDNMQVGSDTDSGTDTVANVNIMDKSWNMVWRLDISEMQVSDHEVATNENGDTVAIWKQALSGVNTIWAATYDEESGVLGDPTDITSGNGGLAFMPNVAMDAAGNTVAVWCQMEGGFFSIYANIYDYASGTWGAVEELDSQGGGHAFSPRLVMDASGNSMAVWYQHDGARFSIFSSRYDAQANEWGEPELVEDNDAGDAYHPQIDGNDSGVVFVAWKQFDGQKNSAWANRYDPVAGAWGRAETVEGNNTRDINYPVVAVNNAGDAIVSWYMQDGDYYHVYGSMYDSKTAAWGEAVEIEDVSEGDAYTPVVDIDDNANIIVVWMQDDGEHYALYARRFDAKSGAWAGTVQLDSGESGDADSPRVAIDKDGNAVVIWQKHSEKCMISAARYDVTTDTWGLVESLCAQIAMEIPESSIIGVYDPRIIFDRNGRAVVIWRAACLECDCIIVSVLN